MLFCCRWECLHLQYPLHYENNGFLINLLSLFVLLLSVCQMEVMQLQWGGGWSQTKRHQISMVYFVFPFYMTKVNWGLFVVLGDVQLKE